MHQRVSRSSSLVVGRSAPPQEVVVDDAPVTIFRAAPPPLGSSRCPRSNPSYHTSEEALESRRRSSLSRRW
jgi:hypothetical protein